MQYLTHDFVTTSLPDGVVKLDILSDIFASAYSIEGCRFNSIRYRHDTVNLD